ncbi:MAG: ribokinase [Chloroflexi bacterium]|nr:ribokinase [Chloroflexota bacterium]
MSVGAADGTAIDGQRVIVVGSVNVDLVVTVDRLPGAGETVTGGTFARHHGGKGGNQAVAAARLGAWVAFVGAVGDDGFGAEARAALEAEGVDHAGLATLPGSTTGVALILVDARAENEIAVASGANAAMTADAVRDALRRLGPGPGDVVLVGTEIPLPAAAAALAAGRAAGALTILNPAPATGIGASLLAAADVITPNRTEVRQLADAVAERSGRTRTPGADVERWARELLADGPEGPGVGRAVVVTLGDAGSLAVERVAAEADPASAGPASAGPASADAGVAHDRGRDRIEVTDVAAHAVAAVDTTGAGDTFSGALAVALAEGRPLADAARWAGAAAALATTRGGAREGMPTRAELEAFLADGG